MGNYTPGRRVGSDADIGSSVLYSQHGFVKHLEHSRIVELNGYGCFLWIAVDFMWFLIPWTGIQWWIQDFPVGGRQPQKCHPNIFADSPRKLQKKPGKLDQAVTRVWCPLPLVPSTVWTVSYFTGSLLTAREGNVFTSICHSVHNWPHGYLVTAHSYYSTVGTHLTGVHSVFFSFFTCNKHAIDSRHVHASEILAENVLHFPSCFIHYICPSYCYLVLWQA